MARLKLKAIALVAVLCTMYYLYRKASDADSVTAARGGLHGDGGWRQRRGGRRRVETEHSKARAKRMAVRFQRYSGVIRERMTSLPPVSTTSPGSRFDHLKKILYWNEAYGDNTFGFGTGQEPFLRANCSVSTCYATHDRQQFPLQEVDALIWHLRSNDKTFPTIRSHHTMYVFWMIESALYTYADLTVYDNVFNWTFTYRTDSEFPRLYGKAVPVAKATPGGSGRNYAEGKNKMAAWFVSNCNTLSQRETLVQTLQRWVGVDIYGSCGPLKCRRQRSADCFRMVERDYKFYLSFENSLCYQYVTEKLYNALRYNVVPVVYGLGYSSLALPPHSYIEVLDFRSVKELADYLKYLNNNDTAYNEYFRWKSDYTIEDHRALTTDAFCSMCEQLHRMDISTRRGGQRKGGRPKKPQQEDAVQQNDRESTLNNTHQKLSHKIFKSKHELKETHENNLDGNHHIIDHKEQCKGANKDSNQSNVCHKKQHPVLAGKYRKTYKSLEKWFVSDQCTEPFLNKKLASFISGKNLGGTKETIFRNENTLPAAVRPHYV